MADNHIIVAGYAGCGYTKTRPAFQHDYGQVLQLDGFGEILPNAFEMHFSIGMGKAITRIGSGNTVEIPNVCFEKFGTVTAWLFLHDGETDGETKYVIEIPVRSRAKATDQEPTPAEQSAITEAIAALNAGVTAAEAAQSAAEDAQEAAEQAKGAAETAKGEAETAQGKAEDAQGAAETAQGKAEDAQAAAEEAQGKAEDAQEAAETAQGKAEEAQEAAEAAVKAYDAMTAEATTLQPGSSATAEIDHSGDHPVLLLGLPQGATGSKGDKGDKGDPGSVPIDDTAGAGDTTKVWSANKTFGEFSDVKSALNVLAKSVDTDAEDVDLDITDPSGNVLVRLEDGHIQTKEFDSSELPDLFDGKQDALTFDSTPTENSTNPVTSGGVYDALQDVEFDTSTIPKLSDTDAIDVDLDITDPTGNVILRLADGHIQTKEFDSRNVGSDMIMEDDDEGADLDITDTFGNVVARFADGHIQTGSFDSSEFESIPNDVETLQDDVTDIQKATSGILYRTMSQTDGVYAACRYNQPHLSDKQFCLLLGADVHADPVRTESMVEYLNANNAFDAGIMLGDMSGNTFADSIAFYLTALAKANKPFLTVIGNHDVNSVTSDADLYTKYGDCFQYAQLASGEAVSGKCYYYKDFASYKIRIIVLMQYDIVGRSVDTGDLCFGQDQIDWFISVLQNTPSDYGVIIAEHTNSSRYMTYNMDDSVTSSTWQHHDYAPTVMDGDPVPDIVNAWINGTSLSHTYNYTFSNPPTPLSVSADFTSRGDGEFITYIGGHWHMNVFGTPTAYTDQPDYHVPAAGLSAAIEGDMPRREGTVSEDSLNVLAVDRVKKTVKVFQIGAHYTKDAVDRQYFKYSYGA